MVFAHDTDMALASAIALVNSAEDPDTLTTIEELDAFFAEYDYTGRHDADDAELAQVRALRPVLRRLLTAERDEAAAQVNAILADARAVPQLVQHAGFDWHIHATTSQTAFAVRVAVETAMAMIDVIRADELSRIFSCADDTCDALVVDLSRNRSKRFCSTTCGNRNAVAAYRARKQSGR
ncbi:MAG: CGNR zinc finger domain-containing protein [Austwickia sp.]|nr:CGNR zinc finger domain-containing protein [Austwickia sp.]MBK8437462.1 CGNR zinc finger domain-containing protein [Austwickia sp.]MBK9102727.1 CGNR zinc finger domain-containing protein [Austwickia sp.]